MRNYLRNWNVMRALRLVFGIYIIVQGFQDHQWIFILLGSVFSMLSLLNIGCCGVSRCNVPKRSNRKKRQQITFEEIDTKYF